jgi:hypothetical protein
LIVALLSLVVLATVSGGTWLVSSNSNSNFAITASGGFLFAGPLLMILFRRKYPRWWFDWNRELLRFTNRVAAYLLLMHDRYPSTDEEQSVHLDVAYPDVAASLNRWLPLVKWLLAIPQYIVLVFLDIAVVVVVVVAWFAVVFSGRYPRGLFDFVEGVIRWHNRVVAYALIHSGHQRLPPVPSPLLNDASSPVPVPGEATPTAVGRRRPRAPGCRACRYLAA